jgi:hypothetical protein
VVIKSGFILNGGGVIAIPASIALFNLDAERLIPLLILTGGLFVGGICSAAVASIFAFLALAHKADSCYSNAVHTARVLEGKYFLLQAEAMAREAEIARRRAARLRAWWTSERFVAMFCCLVSVALFIGGAWFGGNTILKAPHKIAQISLPPLATAPCKDGSQACQPWERDWSTSRLEPGSIVNDKGAIVHPTATKP